MNHAERVVLAIIGGIGTGILVFQGYYTFAGLFLMVLAFIGECVEVIANRLERILTTLEAQE